MAKKPPKTPRRTPKIRPFKAKKPGKNGSTPNRTVNAALETLKKGFLIGLGATVRTADMLKDMMDTLVEQGELNQKDAKRFGQDVNKLVREEKVRIEQHVKEAVEASLKKMVASLDLVTRDELDTLRNELGLSRKPARRGQASQKKQAARVRPKPR